MSATLNTNNSALWKRREAAIPRGVGNMHPVFAARAQNAEIWDEEGRRYIDFASGIAVNNTGHNHPGIQAASRNNSEAFSQSAFKSVLIPVIWSLRSDLTKPPG